MQIKNRNSFNNLVTSLAEEILDETTGTGAAPGYNTPMAFGKKKKKKKKVDEGLETKDLEVIKKLIRSVVGDIYRDIWLKRASWQK